MNAPLITARRIAAVALAIAALPVLASPASAATFRHRHHSQPATTAPAAAPVTTPAPSVTSVISIGGYVFYNLTYAEAVEAWAAAVAAAPPGYQPPAVYSVSVSTTVSGTVDG